MNNFKLLTVNGLELEYLTFGCGDKTLVCFHGFGRKAEDFLPFKKSLGTQFTIHSVNLFYHGNSKFPESRLKSKPLEKYELKSLFEQLRKTEGFINFSLVGYSLGGKVALTLTELYPDHTNNLFLVAPDGIKANLWYYFASQTLIGQKLNRISIKNEWIFRYFMKFSSGLGLASKRQRRFANSQMKSVKQRTLVYKIWMAHRKLTPDLKKIIDIINSKNIVLAVFIGKFDKIIPLSPIEKFVGSIPSASLIYLNSGHKINLNEVGEELTIFI